MATLQRAEQTSSILIITATECLKFGAAVIIIKLDIRIGWWRSTVVEGRSLTDELSLSCARPAADG